MDEQLDRFRSLLDELQDVLNSKPSDQLGKSVIVQSCSIGYQGDEFTIYNIKGSDGVTYNCYQECEVGEEILAGWLTTKQYKGKPQTWITKPKK